MNSDQIPNMDTDPGRFRKGRNRRPVDVTDPNRFSGDGLCYRGKLIGVEPVADARGDKMCQDAMLKLKAQVKQAGGHKQRVVIYVSFDGLKIVDEKNGATLHTHLVHKISFISRDVSDGRAFGYVYGSPEGHTFHAIKTEKAAEGIVLSLRDLFQTVFEQKKAEVEEARSNHGLGSNLQLTDFSTYDNSHKDKPTQLEGKHSNPLTAAVSHQNDTADDDGLLESSHLDDKLDEAVSSDPVHCDLSQASFPNISPSENAFEETGLLKNFTQSFGDKITVNSGLTDNPFPSTAISLHQDCVSSTNSLEVNRIDQSSSPAVDANSNVDADQGLSQLLGYSDSTFSSPKKAPLAKIESPNDDEELVAMRNGDKIVFVSSPASKSLSGAGSLGALHSAVDSKTSSPYHDKYSALASVIPDEDKSCSFTASSPLRAAAQPAIAGQGLFSDMDVLSNSEINNDICANIKSDKMSWHAALPDSCQGDKGMIDVLATSRVRSTDDLSSKSRSDCGFLLNRNNLLSKSSKLSNSLFQKPVYEENGSLTKQKTIDLGSLDISSSARLRQKVINETIARPRPRRLNARTPDDMPYSKQKSQSVDDVILSNEGYDPAAVFAVMNDSVDPFAGVDPFTSPVDPFAEEGMLGKQTLFKTEAITIDLDPFSDDPFLGNNAETIDKTNASSDKCLYNDRSASDASLKSNDKALNENFKLSGSYSEKVSELTEAVENIDEPPLTSSPNELQLSNNSDAKDKLETDSIDTNKEGSNDAEVLSRSSISSPIKDLSDASIQSKSSAPIQSDSFEAKFPNIEEFEANFPATSCISSSCREKSLYQPSGISPTLQPAEVEQGNNALGSSKFEVHFSNDGGKIVSSARQASYTVRESSNECQTDRFDDKYSNKNSFDDDFSNFEAKLVSQKDVCFAFPEVVPTDDKINMSGSFGDAFYSDEAVSVQSQKSESGVEHAGTVTPVSRASIGSQADLSIGEQGEMDFHSADSSANSSMKSTSARMRSTAATQTPSPTPKDRPIFGSPAKVKNYSFVSGSNSGPLRVNLPAALDPHSSFSSDSEISAVTGSPPLTRRAPLASPLTTRLSGPTIHSGSPLACNSSVSSKHSSPSFTAESDSPAPDSACFVFDNINSKFGSLSQPSSPALSRHSATTSSDQMSGKTNQDFFAQLSLPFPKPAFSIPDVQNAPLNISGQLLQTNSSSQHAAMPVQDPSQAILPHVQSTSYPVKSNPLPTHVGTSATSSRSSSFRGSVYSDHDPFVISEALHNKILQAREQHQQHQLLHHQQMQQQRALQMQQQQMLQERKDDKDQSKELESNSEKPQTLLDISKEKKTPKSSENEKNTQTLLKAKNEILVQQQLMRTQMIQYQLQMQKLYEQKLVLDTQKDTDPCAAEMLLQITKCAEINRMQQAALEQQAMIVKQQENNILSQLSSLQNPDGENELVAAQRLKDERLAQEKLADQLRSVQLYQQQQHENIAKQKAEQEEAARQAAVQKAAQEEAARLAAAQEEAARQAAAEKATQEETARQAAAQKAAQEEATRQAAAQEEAARQAAAQKAAKDEAVRQAAAQKAAQEEAARQAAAQKAAQEEAARQAAAQKAAQEEAARQAAAQKWAQEAVQLASAQKSAQVLVAPKLAQQQAVLQAQQQLVAQQRASQAVAMDGSNQQGATFEARFTEAFGNTQIPVGNYAPLSSNQTTQKQYAPLSSIQTTQPQYALLSSVQIPKQVQYNSLSAIQPAQAVGYGSLSSIQSTNKSNEFGTLLQPASHYASLAHIQSTSNQTSPYGLLSSVQPPNNYASLSSVQATEQSVYAPICSIQSKSSDQRYASITIPTVSNVADHYASLSSIQSSSKSSNLFPPNEQFSDSATHNATKSSVVSPSMAFLQDASQYANQQSAVIRAQALQVQATNHQMFARQKSQDNMQPQLQPPPQQQHQQHQQQQQQQQLQSSQFFQQQQLSQNNTLLEQHRQQMLIQYNQQQQQQLNMQQRQQMLQQQMYAAQQYQLQHQQQQWALSSDQQKGQIIVPSSGGMYGGQQSEMYDSVNKQQPSEKQQTTFPDVF